MKSTKYLAYFGGTVLAIGALFASCEKDDKLGESVLNVTPDENKSDIDRWVDKEFRDLYNIRVFHKWNPYKVDIERYLTPPAEENVRPALDVVKGIWLDAYATVADTLFVKETAPRELVLTGSRNMNTNGTNTLGLAEQGYRISLFEVDALQLKSEAAVKNFIHTIQHEYVHILNQRVHFDEQNYMAITSNAYRADWQNASDAEAWSLGFISNYARSNGKEDFAEQASWMLRDIVEYNNKVNAISSVTGKEKIRKKEAMVVSYYDKAFGIDFYELCKETRQRTLDIVEAANN
ncbi:substrate import-associated zinc metallohydrolase lipoprotein [Myroides sp. DW712]|uniref:substrate import-associated zinc metallohydrolase lipoprotein n=1 Tax=Myroides sp. DW712 TaxID=3389800 RepID=UPI003978FFF4